MSTMTEIEAAIKNLSASDRELLESRLTAERLGFVADEELLRSLDEAQKEIENGEGIEAEEFRKEVRTWYAK